MPTWHGVWHVINDKSPEDNKSEKRREQYMAWLHHPEHPERLEKKRATQRRNWEKKKIRDSFENRTPEDGRPRIGDDQSECLVLAMRGRLYG